MAIQDRTAGGASVEEILGDEAEALLSHHATRIPRERLHLPGPDIVERLFRDTDRPAPVLRSLQSLFGTGRLADTGYLSILPVDQGIEHSAGASFGPNPDYFDPVRIVELAIEGGCNAVASTLGVLGSCSRRYAHRIPFIMKINHNELLSYPNTYDQTLFGSVHQARELGAVAVGATVYFGSPESRRQLLEVSEAFSVAHDLGLATVLWCYLRNPAFEAKDGGPNYEVATDLTGQANHLGVTIEADVIKQKAPETAAPGFKDLKFGKQVAAMYELFSDNPIDMTRYQVANCYMGRAPLINSGGASGQSDLRDAVRTAVVNKRAGGAGMIAGRKVFTKRLDEGIAIMHAIQDVYLSDQVTVA